MRGSTLCLTVCAVLFTLVPPRLSEAAPEVGLTLRHGDAAPRTAPALRTDVAIDVSGIVARVRVRQVFRNPDDAWVEGVYTFPLPDAAAVDTLRMKIGERIIVGEIRERAQARQSYVKARRSGRRASLIEQERPNIFTASVANIPPHGEVTVKIGYQERLKFADGIVSLRFPTVLGPRYIHGGYAVAGAGAMGWAGTIDLVEDAARITPPVRQSGPPNALSLTVTLDAGMPIAMLKSPSHAIDAVSLENGRYCVTLKDGVANRDFVLHWRPSPGDAPFAALFREVKDGETYLLAVVAPPSLARPASPPVPREIVFVIDTSGSMHGDSIVQAKEAIQFALRRLRPQDRFNIVRFASDNSALFERARPAGAANLARAKRFVGRLRADGGTEIAAVLRRVLDGRVELPRLRQIILVTDGSVGNEAALFRRIRRGIGDSRLLTIGIGSAPNSYFMRKSAALGRGTFTHIRDPRDVAAVMQRLLLKLEYPVLTGITAQCDGAALPDTLPASLPDLYFGEPLVLTAQLPRRSGTVTLSGMVAGKRWRREFYLASVRSGAGIARLWAHDMISALMDRRHDAADPETVRLAVLDVALRHGLVSKHTSLVAVDRTPARPLGMALDRRAVPVELPAGWTYAAVFGAQTASLAGLHLLAGMVAILIGGLLLVATRRRLA